VNVDNQDLLHTMPKNILDFHKNLLDTLNSMKRDRLPYIFIPLAAFIVVLPLIIRGCSCGHDFDFHIVNWFEVASQLRHGTLYPQWAGTPAWNAGEPRFVFYPPLSWMLGALLGFVMPWTWTPIAYTGIALSAAGFALYAAARDLGARSNARLLAAVVYVANPYMLFTAYERTAYAELLAAAWLPLLLAGILRDRVTIPRIAIPVALLWLTNAPAAVMGCYALALLAFIRLIFVWRVDETQRATTPGAPSSPRFLRLRWASRGSATAPAQFAATTVTATLLGLSLAAVYIIPAAYERRWAQAKMAILPGLSFADNFLFHRTGDPDHDKVLRTASFVAVIMIYLTATALFLAWKRLASGRYRPELAILAAAIVLLLTPLSAFVWKHTPELGFLQFPWRLIAVLSAVFGLTVAGIPETHKPRTTAVVSLVVAVVFVFPAYGAFRQQCYPEDTVAERLVVFQSANPGTDPTDEYTPINADNDSLAPDNPPWWLADRANAAAPNTSPQQPGPAPHALDLVLDRPTMLILNLRRYPAWSIRVNDAPATLTARSDGLVAIALAAGPARIRIVWHNGLDRTRGYILSLLSLILVAFSAFENSRTP
jgi:hypothetical protein